MYKFLSLKKLTDRTLFCVEEGVRYWLFRVENQSPEDINKGNWINLLTEHLKSEQIKELKQVFRRC